jgi:hypothetical protein
MDRDKLGWWLGVVVFALGVALLAFTFYSVFMIASNPNGFAKQQGLSDVPINAQAVTLSVSLMFSPNPVNVNTQVSGTLTINGGSTPYSVWINGSMPTGCVPSSQPMQVTSSPYTFQCTPTQSGQFNPNVDAADGAGDHGSGTASLNVQGSGSGNGGNGNGTGGSVSISFLPIAIVMLTLGAYAIMALVGGVLMKSGWNLIRPRPETIRVRLKPKDLTSAAEPEPLVAPTK